MPCNSECKLGCEGTGIFECNQCRSYKLRLVDLKLIIESLVSQTRIDDSNRSPIETIGGGIDEKMAYYNRQLDFTSMLLNDKQLTGNGDESDEHEGAGGSSEGNVKNTMYLLIQNYQEYYLKKAYSGRESSQSDEDAVFCVSECPAQFPYPTTDFYCSREKQLPNDSIDYFKVIVVFSIIAVMILTASLVFSGVCFKYFERRNKIKFEKEFIDSTLSMDKDEDGQFDQDNMSPLIMIEYDDLTLEKELGSGAFGRVFIGYLKSSKKSDIDENVDEKKRKYAVKQLIGLNDKEKLKEFHEDILNEATLMASVNHPHCLKLSALCLVEPVLMIFPLMKYGSVVQFYQNPAYRSRRVTSERLLKWAEQIADGMFYLESRGIVHRDLAARNILIKKLDHIVITDFGLAKMLDSNEKAYLAKKNSLLPIKWMAIESIQQRMFTHKSDVWSYGVCLWEIFTFCAKPYAEIEPSELVKKILSGVRLSQPQIATLSVYNVMIRCWLADPDARPTFDDLRNEFAKFAMNSKHYLVLKVI